VARVRHHRSIATQNDTEPEVAPDLIETMGGPLGVAETSLPAVAYAAVYTVTDTNTAAIAAVALALVLAVARLAKRESPRHALSGLIGVAFAAFIAARSGKAENFYLPGLLLNAAYAGAFFVSLAVRKPLVALVAGQIPGTLADHRDDPRYARRYVWATWLWAFLFSARLLVQLPLYLAGWVVALGVARTAMGLPLFGLGLWLTWRLVRVDAVPEPEPSSPPEPPETASAVS
jgi:ABC-type amino acid transport system permease subunit